MFGIFAPETVQFVDMKDAVVTFVTKGKKNPGQSLKVRFGMPNGPKPHRLDLTVKLTATRPANQGTGCVCVGIAVVPEHVLHDVEAALRSFAERANMGLAGRRSERLPISLRVMSRELPGFGAVTVDISLHGVRLNCHGPMKQGQTAYLMIESDVASVENMSLKARTVWSRENTSAKGCLVGMEFFDLNPTQLDALERYHKSLAGRLKGDVMHRQIADGEMTVRPNDNVAKPGSGGLLPPPPPPPPV